MEEEFLVRINQSLFKIFKQPFETSFTNKGDKKYLMVLLNASTKPKLQISITIDEISSLMSSVQKWEEFQLHLTDIIMQELYSDCLEDLKKINEFYKHYISNYLLSFKTPDLTQNVDPNGLDQLGLQTFIERLGTNCKTILFLAMDSKWIHFLSVELSIGILLRSCILDSLQALVWGEDIEFMSALGAETFFHKTGVPDEGLEKWQAIGVFLKGEYQQKPREIASNTEIWKRLEKYDYLQNYKSLYYYYSRYDHFSLMPWAYPTSPFDKISMILESLHLVKHALCSLITTKRRPEIPIEPFYSILGMRMYENKKGHFSFTKPDIPNV